MHQSRSYWSYFRRSKGRHGVHSPFVFQLADSCLTTKVDKNFNIQRKKWYRVLRADRETFPVTDLGAGSKQLRQLRSKRDLLKISSSKGIYGDVLWQLAHYFRPKTVLELGTSLGIGTVHLKKGSPESHIITVEGCSNTLAKASQTFDYWNLGGITTICSSFDAFLDHPAFALYDLVFIDGHHDGSATLDYLTRLQNQSHDETLFILDDIRWSNDMWEAWQTIVEDERFHVTIDLGRMGLVWRRPQQTKEHFTIRPKIFKTPFI
jgi:predicted O-methyltransferase YrrM